MSPNPVFGTQWGIFAREDIEAGVLLGEYACDVVEGRDLLLCQKMDSIMMFGLTNTSTDPFLAPILYCGYLLLVNGESSEKCNCSVIRVILEGSVRVLLESCRPIEKGEQLLYDYGSEYRFTPASQSI